MPAAWHGCPTPPSLVTQSPTFRCRFPPLSVPRTGSAAIRALGPKRCCFAREARAARWPANSSYRTFEAPQGLRTRAKTPPRRRGVGAGSAARAVGGAFGRGRPIGGRRRGGGAAGGRLPTGSERRAWEWIWSRVAAVHAPASAVLGGLVRRASPFPHRLRPRR